MDFKAQSNKPCSCVPVLYNKINSSIWEAEREEVIFNSFHQSVHFSEKFLVLSDASKEGSKGIFSFEKL